jgi:hypothetical protein
VELLLCELGLVRLTIHFLRRSHTPLSLITIGRKADLSLAMKPVPFVCLCAPVFSFACWS